MEQYPDTQPYQPKSDRILTEVRRLGTATVADVSNRLEISESTVRRAFAKLDDSGLIRRFHGGAIAIKVGIVEPPVNRRLTLHSDEKTAIGREAAKLVKSGDTIILRSGTTVAAMVEHLLKKQDLRIITNGISFVNEFRNGNHKLILTGGDVDFTEQCTTGSLTPLAMKKLRAERLFTGAMSIHPEYGLMADDFEEMELTRSFIEASEQVIVLVDHSKIGPVAPVVLAPLSEVDLIVTDGGVAPHWIADFANRGVKVMTASLQDAVEDV